MDAVVQISSFRLERHVEMLLDSVLLSSMLPMQVVAQPGPSGIWN
jgi:hypothetical protein